MLFTRSSLVLAFGVAMASSLGCGGPQEDAESTFDGLDGNDELDGKDDSTAKGVEWTVLVYGSLDTHDVGGIPSSLQEMAQKLTRNSPLVNLLYLEDLPGGPNTKLYKVEMRNPSKVVKDYGELHLGKQQTLTDVLRFVRTTYPAKRFFLNLIGHSSSAVRAFLPDYTACWPPGTTCVQPTQWSDQRLAYWQIRQAILDSGGKLDLLSLGGCGSGDLEIVARMSDAANYIVGLQEYSLGYTDVRWADSLVRNPAGITPRGLAYRVAQGMFKKGFYDQAQQEAATGAYDSAKVAAMKAAFTAFAASLNAKLATKSTELAAARKASAEMVSGGFQFLVDAQDFALRVSATTTDAALSSKADAFAAALSSMIVGGYSDPSGHASLLHGVNLIFMRSGTQASPLLANPSGFDEASAWPKAETSFYEATGWRKFVTNIYPLIK